MNKTLLVFDTTADIAEFVTRRRISNAIVDAREVTLAAVLNEGDIQFAIKEYRAQVVPRAKKR